MPNVPNSDYRLLNIPILLNNVAVYNLLIIVP